jgi:hypothetical protein
MKGELITGTIPGIQENLDINIGDKNLSGKSNKPNIGGSINLNNNNLKDEKNKIIVPEISKSMRVNIDASNIKEKENDKNMNNDLQSNLNKEKESKIFENITGSIVGTPRQKYLVEYGSTKGYKRPNIKKGKDFIHNPEIVIEGTISGIKKIPPTLKSFFEDKINSNIQLNKKINDEYIIKEKDIEDYLNLKKSEINIDSPDLKLGNIDVNQPDFKTKEELLKGKIKSIDLSIKNKDTEKNNSLKGPTKIEIKGSKTNDIEISKPNIDINKTSLKDKPNTLKTEIITGTIKGKPQEKVNVKEKIPFSNTSGTVVDINKRPKIDNKIDENKKINQN